MKKRRYVEGVIREKCKKWGFEEIQTPTFEKLELFTLKSGEEIINEIYGFEDKSGRELALRPEITASVIRFYLNELIAKPKPLKLFYFGNCFRYEQPQKGRFREFWQFGTEVIGGDKQFVESELIALVKDIFEELNLDYSLEIGHLGILRELMQEYGVKEEKQNKVLSEIDKEQKNLSEKLKDLNISPKLIKALMDLKESNSPLIDAEKILKKANCDLTKFQEFKKTLKLLKKYGVQDYKIDLSITRGLDYYMGTVFEVYVEELGAQNQVCGGGTYRFSQLMEQETDSSGFALGFDRIIDALKEQGEQIDASPRSEVYVAPLSEEFREKSIEVTREFKKHFSTEIDLKSRGIGDQLSHANKLEIPFVVLIGEEEVNKEKISLKNMDSGKQKLMSINDAIEEIRDYMKKNII